MSQKISITKNLIIGLGGTGMRAVLQTKARCKSIWTTIPNCIQFATIDTDVLPDKFPAPLTKQDLVDDHYYVKVQNPTTLVRSHEEIENSIPVNNRKLLDPFDEGAGQVRSRGRLALSSHRSEIEAFITNKFNGLKNFKQDERFDIKSDKTNVFVITSFAGGTGAGMFADIQYLIRDAAHATSATISLQLIFLLPEIYQGLPATKFINVNTYASFLECEFLAGQFLDKSFTKARENGFDLPFLGGNRKVEIGEDFYDILIPVDGRGSVGFDDANQLADFIGKSLFASMGGVGTDGKSSWNNANPLIRSANQIGGFKGYSYYRTMGMGYSELYYDKKGMTEFVINELIKNITNKLISNDNEKLLIDKENKRYIWDDFNDTYLNEKGDKNDLIDKVFNLSNIKDLKSEAFFEVNTRKENTASDLKNWLIDKDKTDNSLFSEVSKKNTIGIYETIKKALYSIDKDNKTDGYLSKISEYGIGGLLRFVKQVKDHINYVIDELKVEVLVHEGKIPSQKKTVDTKISNDLDNAVRKSSGIFASDKHRKDVVQEIINEKNKNRKEEFNRLRKKEGVDLLIKILGFIEKEILPVLKSIDNNIEYSHTNSSNKFKFFRDNSEKQLPFEVYMHGELIKKKKNKEFNSIEDFEKGYEGICKLIEAEIVKMFESKKMLKDVELQGKFFEHFKNNENAPHIPSKYEIPIDMAIEKYYLEIGTDDEDEVSNEIKEKYNELIEKALKKCHVLYEIDESLAKSPNLDQQYYQLWALPSMELKTKKEDIQNVAKDDEINNLFYKINKTSVSGIKQKQIIVSYDNERYMFIKMQYAAPINALKRIKIYEEEFKFKYLNNLKSDRGSTSVISPFITKQIEDAIRSADFSLVNDKNEISSLKHKALKIWVYGLMTGIISRDQSWNYQYFVGTKYVSFSHERKIKDRSEAFELITTKGELRKEISKSINDYWENSRKDNTWNEKVKEFTDRVREISDDLNNMSKSKGRDQVANAWHSKYSLLNLNQKTIDSQGYEDTKALIDKEEGFIINEINITQSDFTTEY